jgi:hypothetical protein
LRCVCHTTPIIFYLTPAFECVASLYLSLGLHLEQKHKSKISAIAFLGFDTLGILSFHGEILQWIICVLADSFMII